jgi:LPXTG-motif cell wall-anchored protein
MYVSCHSPQTTEPQHRRPTRQVLAQKPLIARQRPAHRLLRPPPAAPSAPVMHPALPHTGSEVIPLASLGALTFLAGAGAVRIASRKSES